MKELEIHRVDGRYPSADLVARFRRHGIVVLKGLLTPDLREPMREIAEKQLERARAIDGVLRFPEFPRADFLKGDILAVRQLAATKHIFFQPELLESVRVVLGSRELVYWGDSSIQFGEAARGFHKDNVERADGSHDDWQGDYGLVRCGFYFQDHAGHSGGLKVRLSSHNIADHRTGKIADMATTFGDVVIWSMRLTHSGNNRKLRAFPRLALHPRLEAAAPPWLLLPEQQRRISAFCAFARPGTHADRYIANMNARDADYRPYFQHARKPADAAQLLSSYGVSFVRPNSYYGELDDPHD
jgi:hypothetical protein